MPNIEPGVLAEIDQELAEYGEFVRDLVNIIRRLPDPVTRTALVLDVLNDVADKNRSDILAAIALNMLVDGPLPGMGTKA